jgi:hypothetical protein
MSRTTLDGASTTPNSIRCARTTTRALSVNFERRICGSDTLDSILNSKIEFDTPQDGDTVSGIVNIAGIAAGMENVSLRFRDSGGELLATETTTLTGTDWEYSWDTSSFSDGPYTIRAYGDGGSSLAFAMVTVQNTAPEEQDLGITITEPADNATVSGTMNISGTASGPADAVQVRVESPYSVI